ncbi:hypothetical protein Y1Q_0012525 [Alligator mississippiensis]|uniref:Uncharacterized protein n=1 Tax=Alligator mississippiensis TaxID=8496 RepID=A0A151M7Y9_ALLMI|nr:hypothetical protein Y1Q_0012525 [Alligator mississippiensis]
MEGKAGKANNSDTEVRLGKKEDTLQTTEVEIEQEKEPERQTKKRKKTQELKTRKKKPDNEGGFSDEELESNFLLLMPLGSGPGVKTRRQKTAGRKEYASLPKCKSDLAACKGYRNANGERGDDGINQPHQ